MTQTEYDDRMQKIVKDYEDAKRSLYIDYAKSQIEFEIGDIISDGTTIIVIEKIGTNKDFGMPYPYYIGKELKRDLTPKKSGATVRIYRNAKLIKAIGKTKPSYQ